MPNDAISEISIEWIDDDGTLTVKELKREVLSKGAWATLLFMYQELNRRTGEYGPAKFRIGRYQKREDVYRPHSKFNISSAKQARKIIETLQTWLDDVVE